MELEQLEKYEIYIKCDVRVRVLILFLKFEEMKWIWFYLVKTWLQFYDILLFYFMI